MVYMAPQDNTMAWLGGGVALYALLLELAMLAILDLGVFRAEQRGLLWCALCEPCEGGVQVAGVALGVGHQPLAVELLPRLCSG